MSASLNGICAGQPSTTQPIAGPWLSPKVVTRKRSPKPCRPTHLTPDRGGVKWVGLHGFGNELDATRPCLLVAFHYDFNGTVESGLGSNRGRPGHEVHA